jgi:hypothetical protein
MSITISLLPVALALVTVIGREGFDAWVKEAQQHKSPTTSVRFLPTHFRDARLLQDALTDFGAQPLQRDDGSIVCRIDKAELVFTQNGDEPFMVEISNGPTLEQVYAYLSGLDQDYRHCVQTAVHEKIKARATRHGMTLESEEVLDDKTIVMTLRVR